MSKNLTEYNILHFIDKEYDNGVSYLNIFYKIKKEVNKVKKLEKYSSLDSNVESIFIFHMIEKKIDLIEFENILQISSNYEDGLSRFFNRRDSSYSEAQSKDASLWDKMGYAFITKEKNKRAIYLIVCH